jgi:hypothetical protein
MRSNNALRRRASVTALVALFGIALATAAGAAPALAQTAPGSDIVVSTGGDAAQAPQPAGARGPFVATSAAGTLVYGWRPAGVRPNSASGCNQEVCLQVIGYSNYISRWSTQGFNDGPICSWPDWWYALNVVATTPILCVDDPGVFFADWYPNRKFTPNPGSACNSWWGINGFPCIIVRK